MGRILGVDFGDAHIGLALSDPDRIFASPHKVIDYKGTMKRGAHLVKEAAEAGEVTLVVVGMPISLSGNPGPKAEQVKEFVTFLKTLVQVPVDTWDERMTTTEARRHLQDAGLNEKQIRTRVDMVAAALILQNYLDAKAREKGRAGE